ncbi:iron-containing alcohol dehydrogenase [Desulfotalea psychrophila]|nr:iron-containing alcohol dehydrogenase [Desulfotalea psychrophila]
MYITKFAIPEIIFGRGSLKHTGKCALRLGAKKVFLVSDSGIEKAGWVAKLISILEAEGVDSVYYSHVSPNPRDFEVEEGAKIYQEEGADVIIALGGGSAIDTAKGIAIIASNGGRIRDYEGANRVNLPLPPMILITTTAGSGSEISQFCIITDMARKVKMSIITRTIVANLAIIDPSLLTTKSTQLIIHSAVDAFAHAVEAYLSKIASPFTETHSLQAIALIYEYLPKAIITGSLDDLEQLSIASVSASMAFSNASLGAEHALAHTLGGYFDIAHGAIHPILLPAVMRFHLKCSTKKLAKIARTISVRQAATEYDTALAGIMELEHFFSKMPVATKLSEIITYTEEDRLKKICKVAIEDACILTNPRPVSWEDLFSICQEVW